MKLGYFWRHAYTVARSGPHTGCVVNPDTGRPVLMAEDQLRTSDFRKAKHADRILPDPDCPGKGRRPLYSPLWQADGKRIHRVAPADFIARHEPATFCTTSLCI